MRIQTLLTAAATPSNEPSGDAQLTSDPKIMRLEEAIRQRDDEISIYILNQEPEHTLGNLVEPEPTLGNLVNAPEPTLGNLVEPEPTLGNLVEPEPIITILRETLISDQISC